MAATLLVYSGRPNPRWQIPARQARAIVRALASLPAARRGAPPVGGLGYSGVQLEFADAGGRPRRALIFDGSVWIDGTAHDDRGRRLERFVLASGGAAVRAIGGLP